MPDTTQRAPGFAHRFLIRWLVSGLGLWIAAGLLSDGIALENRLSAVVLGGLVLAILNTILKPIVVVFSLPAILFTLGLFMIVINGLMIMLASKIYEPLHVSNIWWAMLAGMIIGLVNYLVTAILEDR